MDAEYTFINPALSLLVTALAMRWNRPEEGGPWVWNTYQAYLKVRWGWGVPARLRVGTQQPDPPESARVLCRTLTNGWSRMLRQHTRLAWHLG